MPVSRWTIAIGLVTVRLCWMPMVSTAAQFNGGQLSKSDETRLEFLSPPDSAKPRVWWHWMNGNVTKQGIKLDLEWMHRIGIGGVQNFDASLLTPQTVDPRLVFMTPHWDEAFRYAVTFADELGL